MQFSAHAMQQRLRTDDRIAFPFGCSAEDDYSRYCSDGSFDYYDFRTEGERRTSSAGELALSGRQSLGGFEHRWSAGLLATRFEARFNRQAYNWVGIGQVDGEAVVPADPSLTDENTQRDERSTEWRLQDVMTLNPQWQLWAGLRHTRLQRASVRTDGSRATDYAQRFNTPWASLVWQASPELMVYTSWGQGMETEVAPNRSRYRNAGEPLPALKSRQTEIGLKHRAAALQWQLALFDTRRPVWSDIRASTGVASDSCSDADPCTRRADGVARHRGLEAEAEWSAGALSLRGSALWLRARREGAADPASNGLQPTNVPEHSLKMQAAWNLDAVPGLALLGFVSREGARMVTPDNAFRTDGWTRIDLGLRYAQRLGTQRWVWRLGVDNVADERAWKESPFQYGHAYLYPLAPRTWRAALHVTL
jgi:iron complex outermembrane receptor protein